MDVKSFRAGVIFTAYHGQLLCAWGEFMELLNYMCGDDIFTSSILAAMDHIKPYLHEQFAWLADVTPPSAGEHPAEVYYAFAEELDAKHGKAIPVYPVPFDDMVTRDPIADLLDAKPDADIVLLDDFEDDDDDDDNLYGRINWGRT